MRQNTIDIQLKHRDEAPARIKADPQDRLSLRQALHLHLPTITPAKYPESTLINIVSGEMVQSEIRR